MKKKPKFKLGQVVMVRNEQVPAKVTEPPLPSDPEPNLYEVNGAAQSWYTERELRPLTKRERG